jgi:hypothetical protein
MSSRLPTLWGFLRDASNRKVLGWLGGGAVTAAGAVWLVVTHFLPAMATSTAPSGDGAPRVNCEQVVERGVAACEGGVRVEGPFIIH